ncbi:MAG TPA: hypothetical protein VNT42_06150, partial [Sphingomonas sp.]|nr:hypothetical protein [Sphingomonas sp.]
MGGWHASDASGKEITSTLHYDANGFPTGNAQVASEAFIVGVDPYDSAPSDQYVLTYTGTATVKLTNATIVSSAPGKVVFEVKAETNGYSSVMFTLKGLNASDPIT